VSDYDGNSMLLRKARNRYLRTMLRECSNDCLKPAGASACIPCAGFCGLIRVCDDEQLHERGVIIPVARMQPAAPPTPPKSTGGCGSTSSHGGGGCSSSALSLAAAAEAAAAAADAAEAAAAAALAILAEQQQQQQQQQQLQTPVSLVCTPHPQRPRCAAAAAAVWQRSSSPPAPYADALAALITTTTTSNSSPIGEDGAAGCSSPAAAAAAAAAAAGDATALGGGSGHPDWVATYIARPSCSTDSPGSSSGDRGGARGGGGGAAAGGGGAAAAATAACKDTVAAAAAAGGGGGNSSADRSAGAGCRQILDGAHADGVTGPVLPVDTQQEDEAQRLETLLRTVLADAAAEVAQEEAEQQQQQQQYPCTQQQYPCTQQQYPCTQQQQQHGACAPANAEVLLARAEAVLNSHLPDDCDYGWQLSDGSSLQQGDAGNGDSQSPWLVQKQQQQQYPCTQQQPSGTSIRADRDNVIYDGDDDAVSELLAAAADAVELDAAHAAVAQGGGGSGTASLEAEEALMRRVEALGPSAPAADAASELHVRDASRSTHRRRPGSSRSSRSSSGENSSASASDSDSDTSQDSGGGDELLSELPDVPRQTTASCRRGD
jgi:hypothetical protein